MCEIEMSRELVFGIVKAFAQEMKDHYDDYIQEWLKGNVIDSDTQRVLNNERICRESIYKELAKE